MPRFKTPVRDLKFVAVYFDEQAIPGTFEHALVTLSMMR